MTLRGGELALLVVTKQLKLLAGYENTRESNASNKIFVMRICLPFVIVFIYEINIKITGLIYNNSDRNFYRLCYVAKKQ
jgi:hypothetical protein